MKLKIGVIGSTGRVGKELANLILEKGHEAFIGISSGKKSSDAFTLQYQNLDSPECNKVDLWIDFSQPQVVDNFYSKLALLNKPLVVGTTGLNEKQFDIIKKTAEKIPLLWSSNMSIGIAVLNQALKSFEKIKEFDFQIEEFHHNKKKDSPSGTAISLQKTLKKHIQKEIPEPLSIRGGGIFGVHKVWAMSDQEVLCFEHQALNRRVFAEGALYLGFKLKDRKPGYYEVSDLL